MIDGKNLPQIPQSWKWVKLKDISDIGQGGTPSTSVSDYWTGSIPWLRSGEIRFNRIKESKEAISELGLQNSPARLLPKGTVLLAMTGQGLTRGRAAILDVDASGNQSCAHLILEKNTVISEFLFYYFRAEYWRVRSFDKGSNQPGLNTAIIKEFTLPLPPLPEQHRIVTKIEELFTQLDAGVASLKKVQAQLKRYRQAVLKAAFEGRLTQEWREEHKGKIEPADLFIRKLQEKKIKSPRKESTIQPDISSLPSLPDSWTYATADQLSQTITDGEHIMPERGEIGIPYVSARNVQNGYLNLDSVDHVSDEVYLVISKRLVVESGDILLSCSGSVGRTCVVPENFKCTLNRSVAIIKPIEKMGLYLSYALRSSFLQRQIDEKKTQTAQANIFQGKIRTLTFPIAPQSEQKEIVIEIERHFSQIDHLEQTITTSLRQADSLRQSVLKRAFEGKIVPQDPNDEPASILLERIKAEKTKTSTNMNKGKRVRKSN